MPVCGFPTVIVDRVWPQSWREGHLKGGGRFCIAPTNCETSDQKLLPVEDAGEIFRSTKSQSRKVQTCGEPMGNENFPALPCQRSPTFLRIENENAADANGLKLRRRPEHQYAEIGFRAPSLRQWLRKHFWLVIASRALP